MMNMSPFEMMKRISELEKNVNTIYKSTEGMTITGESGAGMVKASINMEGIIKDLEISDEAFAMEDKNALIVLITSAINNAQEKKKGIAQDLIMKAARGEVN